MVEIGGLPILRHIMMCYSNFGFKEFVIALGYKGSAITTYIQHRRPSDTGPAENVKIKNGKRREVLLGECNVELVDTGIPTQTGGRIKRLAPYLGNETFMMTWCDGLSDVNLNDLLTFHRSHGKTATLTAVHPPERFGYVKLDGDRVLEFSEKPMAMDRWINGAFFVLEPKVFDYIEGDDTQWEKEPLERLAGEGQLMAYRHTGFWQCMDTISDKRLLEELWQSGNAPWKIWE
jgi:glucose-1-phosphate cytidylyltransferase